MTGLRASQLFWQLITELKTQMPGNRVAESLFNFRVNTAKMNFFDVEKSEDNVMISFLPTSRLKKTVPEAKQFFASGRQTARVGATIKKILMDEVPELHLKKFTEALSAAFLKTEYEISVVKGKDMVKYFLQDSFIVQEESELWKSCMRHDKCRDYFEIYTDNENLSMVIATKNGKLAARGLIWSDLELVENPVPSSAAQIDKYKELVKNIGKERLVMLDRIYAIDPKAKNVLWQWGLANVDILHSIPKDANTFFIPKLSASESLFLQQKISKYKYYSYPWIDTMGYFSIEKNVLSNHQMYYSAGYRDPGMLFHNTDGAFAVTTSNSPSIDMIRNELTGKPKKKPVVPKPNPRDVFNITLTETSPTTYTLPRAWITSTGYGNQHPIADPLPIPEDDLVIIDGE
jgi:hypothetical protein